MYTNLNCGALSGRVELDEAVELAAEFGYGAVAPDVGALTGSSTAASEGDTGHAAEVGAQLRSRGLRWGAMGAGIDPSTADDQEFDEALRRLDAHAKVSAAAGVDRAVRWLRPASDDLTYRENFALHVRRLRAAAEVLGGHGIRLGLEYVGPKTMWANGRFPFVHTLAETRELIAEAGAGNLGLCLDSYHWHTAGETAEDLRALTDADVVSLDLNDAQAGVPRDELVDQRRELPGRTGVIDVAAMLGALRAIGYTGPVQAEPFNAELRKLSARDAARETAKALTAVLGS